MKRYAFVLASLCAVLGAGLAAAQTQSIQDEINRNITKARAAGRTEEHIEIFCRLLNRGLAHTYSPNTGAGQINPTSSGHSNTNDFFYDHLIPQTGTVNYSGLSMIYPTLRYDPPYQSANTPQASSPTYNNLNAPSYYLGPNNLNAYSSWLDTNHHLAPLPIAEGVYLKGHGVVCTATVPFAARLPQTTAEKPVEKPLSPWEQERRNLRGEKAETPKKTTTAPPSVSDTILRLLADNGSHFTELAPDELVTIAVVFRPGKYLANQQCAVCHQTLKTMYTTGTAMGTSGSSSTTTGSSGSSGTTGTSGSSGSAEQTKVAESIASLFRNDIALADLHFKQGKAREAEKVYRKVIEQCADMLAALDKLPAENSHSYRLYVITLDMELHGKLAQVQLALADKEGAQKTLQGGVELFRRRVDQLGTAPKTVASPPPSTVPAKLVVSAPKKVLDQVGAGKLSFEEFRKIATVEYTGVEKDAAAKP